MAVLLNCCTFMVHYFLFSRSLTYLYFEWLKRNITSLAAHHQDNLIFIILFDKWLILDREVARPAASSQHQFLGCSFQVHSAVLGSNDCFFHQVTFSYFSLNECMIVNFPVYLSVSGRFSFLSFCINILVKWFTPFVL